MKLDKYKFAKLIAYINTNIGHVSDSRIETIDELTDVTASPTVSMAAVDELLDAIRNVNDGAFIPAIKAYRALTGASLIDAKSAIECFRKY